MKKLLCFVFALVLVMSFAVTSAMATTFSLYVQCMNESDLTYRNIYDTKCITAGRMYAKHSVSGGNSSYTNLIHVTKPTNWLIGQKWATPGLKVPIQSNLIEVTKNYGCAARGNTDHYINDGITNVTLNITYTGN